MESLESKIERLERALYHGSCAKCKWLGTEGECTNIKSPIYPDFPFTLMLCVAYEEKEVIDD